MRLTTRYDVADVFTGLLSAMHESGHAMYHMGLPEQWRDQPVGRDRGMVAQESQSLLLERLVCRSRAFSQYLSPQLQRHFGVSGAAWEPDNLYAHLTRVSRGAIRVDADELTYPLHVLVRYELEKRLMDGSLAVRDLPEAWNTETEQRLGFRPQNDREGCLQDIHWAVGSFGYFPSYALGAVMAVQLIESLRNDVHDLDEQIARGDFSGLFGWLRSQVHSQGARLTLQELLLAATGKTLSAVPFMRYLEGKYLESVTSSSAAA